MHRMRPQCSRKATGLALPSPHSRRTSAWAWGSWAPAAERPSPGGRAMLMPHTALRCQARQCRRSGASLEARASHVHGPGAAACIYRVETCHLAEVRSKAAGHLPGQGIKLGHAASLKPALNLRTKSCTQALYAVPDSARPLEGTRRYCQ